jgi:hypothetical protein
MSMAMHPYQCVPLTGVWSKSVAGTFDEARHALVNFSVAEMSADLGAFIEALRAIHPRVRIILSVSPVPLVATATHAHVLCANTYSKLALRVVADEASRRYPRVTYFPAYEIVTGLQAPPSFMGDDRRSVSPLAIQTVMFAFLSHCELRVPLPEGSPPTLPIMRTRPDAGVEGTRDDSLRRLSAAIADAECEEAMQDLHH